MPSDATAAPAPEPEIHQARTADVGGAAVRRALPRRGHRTVGAWCFADHFGPALGTAGSIGPHPHIGLQTVTWLLEGELLHRDSLGSEQLIRPGQLNLMTAGHGVVHAEEVDATWVGPRHGVQLWVALPEASRGGPAAFEHHAVLPEIEFDGASGVVLVGEFDAAVSPARADTDHVGVELTVWSTTNIPLRRQAEYALIPLNGPIALNGTTLGVGELAYLAPGRDEIELTPDLASRALLVGGSPFEFEPLMWWNFVARTRDEISQAFVDWEEGDPRFGPVASKLDRVSTSAPMWLDRS